MDKQDISKEKQEEKDNEKNKREEEETTSHDKEKEESKLEREGETTVSIDVQKETMEEEERKITDNEEEENKVKENKEKEEAEKKIKENEEEEKKMKENEEQEKKMKEKEEKEKKVKRNEDNEKEINENDKDENNIKGTERVVDKTVKFSDTQINISDTEDEYDSSDMAEDVRKNNPKITISEPTSSPSEIEKPQESRGRCPIYYGIKSYIHDFYQPPDSEVLKSGEYIQNDDFQFLVEPGKRRWQGCWFRTGLWVGINLMLLGIIAMLVGHLTKPRETIVGQQGNITVLDRWAVTFNNRLLICQLAGLAGFTSGAVIVMLALLVSSYQQRPYYVMAATVVPEMFVGTPKAGARQGWGSHRIPLSGTVRGVQPTFHH